jgi:hypothetical protein
MRMPKVFDDVLRFFSGAVTRIFGPTDDNYPKSGTQPYGGDAYDEKTDHGR